MYRKSPEEMGITNAREKQRKTVVYKNYYHRLRKATKECSLTFRANLPVRNRRSIKSNRQGGLRKTIVNDAQVVARVTKLNVQCPSKYFNAVSMRFQLSNKYNCRLVVLVSFDLVKMPICSQG